MPQFSGKCMCYYVGMKCHRYLEKTRQNVTTLGINYYSGSKCHSVTNCPGFRSKRPFLGGVIIHPLCQNVTVTKYHSRWFVMWMLCLDQNVAWPVLE
jgi:hypothetical protein